jgi:hypothetical protein
VRGRLVGLNRETGSGHEQLAGHIPPLPERGFSRKPTLKPAPQHLGPALGGLVGLGSPQKRNDATASPACRAPRPGARRSSGPSRSCRPGSTYGSNSDAPLRSCVPGAVRTHISLPGREWAPGTQSTGLAKGRIGPSAAGVALGTRMPTTMAAACQGARRHAKRQRLRLSQLSRKRLSAAASASAAAAAAAAVVAVASGDRRAQERNACPVSKA